MRLLFMKKETEKRVSYKAPNALRGEHIVMVARYGCALLLRAAQQYDIRFGMAADERQLFSIE